VVIWGREHQVVQVFNKNYPKLFRGEKKAIGGAILEKEKICSDHLLGKYRKNVSVAEVSHT